MADSNCVSHPRFSPPLTPWPLRVTGKPADAAKEREIERLHAKIGQLIVERDL